MIHPKHEHKIYDKDIDDTVRTHVKVLSLNNLGGLTNRVGKRNNVWERRDKTYLRSELKVTYHFILCLVNST